MRVHLVGENAGLRDQVAGLLAEEGLDLSRGRLRNHRVLVIVGPRQRDPAAMAQHVHRKVPGAHVLLVVDDARLDEARADMALAPGLGKDIEVLALSEANQARLRRVVRSAVAAQRSRRRMDEANDFLARVRNLI